MLYRHSFPLERWSGERRAAIDLLARTHRHIGDVGGPGRPPEVGRPLAHAYILRVVAEFQGFVRDLHGLTADRLVAMSQVPTQHHAELVTAITHGRRLDSGNADLAALREDFKRLGITELRQKLSQQDQRYWTHDQAKLDSLLRLRNALAHGNQTQLDRIRGEGIRDTRSWASRCVPALDRITSALDRVVWDHLRNQFGDDPW
jgi:hypothetical protein